MTSQPRSWFAAFIAAVLVVGALAGVLIDRAWGRRPPDFREQGPGPVPFAGQGGQRRGGPPLDRAVADLDRVLAFTPEQRQRVRALLDARQPRLRQMQDEVRERFIDEQRQVQNEIMQVLTPRQGERFLEIMARRPDVLTPGMGRRGGGGPGRAGDRNGREFRGRDGGRE